MSEVTDHNTVSLSEQAAEWVVRLSDSQISTAQQADFEAWLAQDIRHREAYEQISRLWQSVTPQRRRKHRPAGLLASIVLVLIGIYCLPLSTWLADERTATGEIRQVALPDGSTITLDSDSAADVVFDTHARRIILHRGRIFAAVVPDAAEQGAHHRPFIIENRDGTAQALGTRYIVEQTGDHSRVSVVESSVNVTSRDRPDQSITVYSGQSIRFDSEQIHGQEPIPPAAASWVQSRLVYRNAPLSQVIDDLARYRTGFLRISGAAAQLRFTGVLPVDDPDTALKILQHALPIGIDRYTRALIWINLQT